MNQIQVLFVHVSAFLISVKVIFYDIELLCIFLYFVIFFVVNLFSVIYMKDVENVS